jgi:hypothetical protein
MALTTDNKEEIKVKEYNYWQNINKPLLATVICGIIIETAWIAYCIYVNKITETLMFPVVFASFFHRWTNKNTS